MEAPNPLRANAELVKGDVVLNTGWSISGCTVLVCTKPGLNNAERAEQLNRVKDFFVRMHRALNTMVESEKEREKAKAVEKQDETFVPRPEPVTPPVTPPDSGLHL